MQRKIINYKSEAEWLAERAKVLTSTSIAALFGLSKYSTEFEEWHHKKNGTYAQIDESERMKWGTRLEQAIAEGVAKDSGWIVKPKKHFIVCPEIRLGSSFDYEVVEPFNAILEIKAVDPLIFKNEWEIDDDGNIEATPYIEVQAQTQMLVSGVSKLYIAALVGGNKVILLERDADVKIQNAILSKVQKFWASIDANEPPKPDFAKDSEFIASLYQYAEPNKVLNVEGNETVATLMGRYKEAQELEKKSKELKDAIKAEILMMADDAEKIIGDGFSISMGMVSEAQINYTRKAYRNFRPFFKKEKK